MQVIVSSKNNKRETKKWNKSKWMWLLMAISVALTIVFLLNNLYFFILFVPLGSFIFGYYKTKQVQKFFIAYISNAVLHIDFEDPLQDNIPANRAANLCRLQLMPNTLIGYTLHAFMGKEPELMEIKFLYQDKVHTTRSIPFYYLDIAQQQTFIQFIDSLIANVKRLKD